MSDYRYELLIITIIGLKIKFHFDSHHDAVEAFTALSVLCPELELELTQLEYSGDCIFSKKLMSTND